MAGYLFKAPDADMDRWKGDAEKRGRSFAEHIRVRLDGPEPPTPKVKLVTPPLPRAPRKSRPDPKPSQRKGSR